MRTSRQEYKDATYEEAIAAGCDTLQLKFDGWWARVEVIAGELKIYTRTGRHLPDFDTQLLEPINCTVIGELMYGTHWSQKPQLQGKLYVFDAWQADSVDLEGLPYRDRYAILKTLKPILPDSFIRVANFNIADYDNVWRTFVASGEYEGVVFRRRNDTVGATLLRHKNTITDEYTALDFIVGEGKHANRLGAIVVGDVSGRALYDSSGRPATVGGGFDDNEREEILRNKELYRNRRFEAEGKGRFGESNLLRHPNFVRWSDKVV